MNISTIKRECVNVCKEEGKCNRKRELWEFVKLIANMSFEMKNRMQSRRRDEKLNELFAFSSIIWESWTRKIGEMLMEDWQSTTDFGYGWENGAKSMKQPIRRWNEFVIYAHNSQAEKLNAREIFEIEWRLLQNLWFFK